MLRDSARLHPVEIDLGQAGLSLPRIALVRHPPVLGGDGRCYGQTDLPLADADLSSLVSALLPMRGATVWTSPLARCRIVARELTAHPIIDDRLMEMNFGAWEGLAWNDVPRADLDLWAEDLAGFAAPRGESGHDLIARVAEFWRDLEPGSHVLVTHGGPLKVLTALAEGVSIDLSRPPPAMGSVTFYER